MSIVTLNLSLMLNPVGFYQVGLRIRTRLNRESPRPKVPGGRCPLWCTDSQAPHHTLRVQVERFWLGKHFTRPVVFSVLVVVVGVAIVTVTDLSAGDNFGGVVVAGLSVLSSGMQQIFCRTMQQKHKLSSHELLSNTAPAQGWTLMVIGPILDRYVSRAWVFDYKFGAAGLLCLATSCALAVGVNLSQFACLGRFLGSLLSGRATCSLSVPLRAYVRCLSLIEVLCTFGGMVQVLGHSKTILVLLGGWMFLGDQISLKQFFGMVTAVVGMVLYRGGILYVSTSYYPALLGMRQPHRPARPLAADLRV